LSIVTEVTFVVDQERVEEPPAVMVDGVAVKLPIDGGGFTVIVIAELVVPPGPVAVSV